MYPGEAEKRENEPISTPDNIYQAPAASQTMAARCPETAGGGREVVSALKMQWAGWEHKPALKQ